MSNLRMAKDWKHFGSNEDLYNGKDKIKRDKHDKICNQMLRTVKKLSIEDLAKECIESYNKKIENKERLENIKQKSKRK